jgi:hypothetical protein
MYMAFPNDRQFDENKTMGETMKWRDLPLGIYRIDKMRDIETSAGEAMILDLANKEGKQFNGVWAPEKLKRQLGNFSETNYLRNNGLKKSKRNQYWDFDMLFLEEPNPLYA